MHGKTTPSLEKNADAESEAGLTRSRSYRGAPLGTDEDAAQRLRFLGSPTIRAGGRDVDPHAHERDRYVRRLTRT